jgi:hypothetical protein
MEEKRGVALEMGKVSPSLHSKAFGVGFQRLSVILPNLFGLLNSMTPFFSVT